MKIVRCLDYDLRYHLQTYTAFNIICCFFLNNKMIEKTWTSPGFFFKDFLKHFTQTARFSKNTVTVK